MKCPQYRRWPHFRGVHSLDFTVVEFLQELGQNSSQIYCPTEQRTGSSCNATHIVEYTNQANDCEQEYKIYYASKMDAFLMKANHIFTHFNVDASAAVEDDWLETLI